MIKTERIGCFNPFQLPAFKCPVCGSNSFVELTPGGGVWCEKCNAQFSVKGTCDGLRKLAVRCNTKDVHKEFRGVKGLHVGYGAVIWEGDRAVTWLELGG